MYKHDKPSHFVERSSSRPLWQTPPMTEILPLESSLLRVSRHGGSGHTEHWPALTYHSERIKGVSPRWSGCTHARIPQLKGWINLECCLEKDARRIVQKLRSYAIVIALNLDKIFIPCVFVMNFLTMVQLNEFVAFSRHKQRRNEGFVCMIDGLQRPDIEACFSLNR